ncbi:BRCT domain-containing DNA repair protein [Striga asiatica]|uniref:BRCT domain-containing DNA repair protein n=1 Tax=Striga asiatica TaxID=4170 RepID=A0A5A7Q135_STRAF|nr:BRCT domain-containing DNA repair protein [Striga asiatica]
MAYVAARQGWGRGMFWVVRRWSFVRRNRGNTLLLYRSPNSGKKKALEVKPGEDHSSGSKRPGLFLEHHKEGTQSSKEIPSEPQQEKNEGTLITHSQALVLMEFTNSEDVNQATEVMEEMVPDNQQATLLEEQQLMEVPVSEFTIPKPKRRGWKRKEGKEMQKTRNPSLSISASKRKSPAIEEDLADKRGCKKLFQMLGDYRLLALQCSK